MTACDWITATPMWAGLFFLLTGALGLVRFPSVYDRLHAVTKTGHLGLGLIALGLALDAHSTLAALKLALVWALVLVASTTACHLIANAAVRAGRDP